MCGSLSVEALQGHRLCFFPPPLPPSSGHTVLPKGKSELSTRTHPQTGRAQSKTQLDNRSSHNIFVSEEISEQYFTFISLEIKDRVCQWIPVIRQKNTSSDDKFFFVRKKWESIGVDNVCLRPPCPKLCLQTRVLHTSTSPCLLCFCVPFCPVDI